MIRLALTLAVLASPLAAQGRNCAPRDVVVERLATGYGETRQSVGIGLNHAMVEVFASEDTGSWTILVTQGSGITCIVASGQSYENVAEVLPDNDTDL